MEPGSRVADQQVSPYIPQPPNHCYFTEQARRAGYIGPQLARTSFMDHHHPHPLHPHPRPLTHPQSYPPPYPHDMREAILREIEKERIREEIIISEIARRRVLEAEIRRELMMERESALQRGGDGFPFRSSPQMNFDPPTKFAISATRLEERSREERMAMLLEETRRLNGRHERGEFDALPFQRGNTDLRISEVKSVSGGGKEKVTLLAKPGENISGSKRKAMSSPGADASEIPSDEISKKKARVEWSCAICQVSTSSEQVLNEHLQGKKHKSKEAALRAQRSGKNCKIGLFPKKDAKSIQAVGTVDSGTEKEVKNTAESLHSKKKNQSELVPKVQENDDLKMKNFTFWCETCKVGAFTQKVMNAHKKGKKHMTQIRKSDQTGGAGPSQPEKIAELVNHAESVTKDVKIKNIENVDETLDQVKLANNEAVDGVEPEDH